MRVEELVSGKKEQDSVSLDGTLIPVKSLNKLLDEGYEQLRPYKESRTFSFWGKACTACFTEAQLMDQSRS
jgi:hypothetical protein